MTAPDAAMTVELRTVLRAAALTGALACASVATGFAAAQGTPHAMPDTRQMIDALKPAANRSMRNLVVRPTAPEPAASAAGSVASTVATPPALPSAPTSTSTTTTSPAPASSPEPPSSLSLAIQFDLNSARVRPESGAVLGNLVAALLSPELKGNRFLIEGHTDARGVPAANLRLSQQRAEEVRLYLMALGVHPERLKAVGKGSREPANPLDPLSADNRRVRVVTLE